MSDNISLFPIAGWTIQTLPERAVMMTIAFLTTPFDTLSDAQSRNFCMTASQARELAEVLLRGADAAEKRTDRMPGASN